MPADSTFLLTRPPTTAPKPRTDDAPTILREYAARVPAMGAPEILALLRGEAPMVVLERCARLDGARLGPVTQ